MSADAAAAELQRVIGEAYEAGVSITAPTMRKAASLLAALETAAAADNDEGSAISTDGDDMDLDKKLDAVFGDGFAMPSGELDLDLD